MKSKLFGLIIGGIVTATILISVGGWLEGSSNNDDQTNPGNQGGSTPIVEVGIDVMPLTEFNTDTPFENITIEIIDHFNNKMIYKVTNNSNVCYEYLTGYIYFKSDPINGFPSLKENEEFKEYFWFNSIPANSVTYYLEDAFSVEVGKYPNTKTAYYPFELGVDPYRIEFDEESKISSELIQDAKEYLVFNKNDFDASINQLGTIENKSNHIIQFSGFVVFENGETAKISNFKTVQERGLRYEGYIPAYKDSFKLVDSYVCPVDFSGEMTTENMEKQCEATEFSELDCNTIYIDSYSDIDTITQDYDLYINAWFSEVE